ncbi:carbohydrate binding-domain-containing protein [Mycena galopus ATCC 62051]|nr:carbohydrate binding-domain-containing protein [Mycena galopus ATCC 62051]
MVQLVSFVLTAVLASIGVVATESLENCGSSRYYPSQPNTSTPASTTASFARSSTAIGISDAAMRATPEASIAARTLTTLEPINKYGPEVLEDCGTSRFYPSQYVCYDGDFLCPVLYGEATLKCGTACYDPAQYDCTDDQLGPVGQY